MKINININQEEIDAFLKKISIHIKELNEIKKDIASFKNKLIKEDLN